MRTPVFIGSAFVAKYPEGGGNFWVPLQYLLGLRALGVDAHWVELVWRQERAARADEILTSFPAYLRALGVQDWVTLVVYPESERDQPSGPVQHIGLPPEALWERARDGVLLNLANSIPVPLRAHFGRTVLFDIDPGPFQIWARDSDLGVGKHDAYLTIGQNLGAPDCPVPVDGVPWRRVWPAVHLPAWPYQSAPDGGRYTTVTQWWNGTWVQLGEETLDGNKRSGFLGVVELPERVDVALELAANIHPGELEDRALLARHRWHLADPVAVAGTPVKFRDYVQRSRGEFSCAKPAYVRTRPGWVSDRTVCYLASGRPCVVQDTGAAHLLPSSPGLRFFTSLDEAAEALRAIERDYRTAARAARALAEEVFSTTAVLPGLLRAVGA